MWWLRECWRILHRWNLAMQLLPWMANAVAGFSASLEQRNHHGSIEVTMAATQFCQVCTMLTSGADQLLEQVSKGTSAWTVLLATKLTKLLLHLHTSTPPHARKVAILVSRGMFAWLASLWLVKLPGLSKVLSWYSYSWSVFCFWKDGALRPFQITFLYLPSKVSECTSLPLLFPQFTVHMFLSWLCALFVPGSNLPVHSRQYTGITSAFWGFRFVGEMKSQPRDFWLWYISVIPRLSTRQPFWIKGSSVFETASAQCFCLDCAVLVFH